MGRVTDEALDSRPAVVAGDTAVTSAEEDAFGRRPLARRVAAEVRSAPAGGGFVIALCGAWGSGKSSVANMVMERLDMDEAALVVRFNPWMFSGSHDLVERFFVELAATLGKGPGRLQSVARQVSKYAGALARGAQLVPVAGPYASAALDVGERLASAGGGRTLDETHVRLAGELGRLDRRIVVLLDDLDRLADDEIRDVVRLVKSVGDLPNMVYVLVFDRVHVEHVLGHPLSGAAAQARGRAYLEKIVQVRHDVPAPRRRQLSDFFFAQLDPVLRTHGTSTASHSDLGAMLQAASGMLDTPRDAKRVANAVSSGLALHADEVSSVDLVGLETLRVLEPNLHADLDELEDVLLGASSSPDDDAATTTRKGRLKRALAGSERREPTMRLLGELFPGTDAGLDTTRTRKGAEVERAERRVAVREVFLRYVHANLSETELPTAEVERVASALATPEEFATLLDRYDGDHLADLLERLPGYVDRLQPSQVVSIAAALLRRAEQLPSAESPFGLALTASAVRYESLLARIMLIESDPARRRANLRELVEDTPSLSVRWQLLHWFGTVLQRARSDSERELLDTPDTEALSSQLAELTLGATLAQLEREELTLVLLRDAVQGSASARTDLIERAREHEFMLLLVGRLTYVFGGAAGPSYPFDWVRLETLLGEPAARECMISLADAVDLEELDERTRAGLAEGTAIARNPRRPRRRHFL